MDETKCVRLMTWTRCQDIYLHITAPRVRLDDPEHTKLAPLTSQSHVSCASIKASSSALSAPLPASIGHRLLHHPLRRVALDDTLLDGLLPLRPFGEDAVHVDVAPLADAQHAPDGLLLVGRGVDAVGVVAPQRRVEDDVVRDVLRVGRAGRRA